MSKTNKEAFLEEIEFTDNFPPFEKGTKVKFGDEMKKILEFYLRNKESWSKSDAKKVAERMKINVIVGENGTGKSRLLATINSTGKAFLKKYIVENKEIDRIVSSFSIMDVLSINAERNFKKKKVLQEYISNNLVNSILKEISDNIYLFNGTYGEVLFKFNSLLVTYYKLILDEKIELLKDLIDFSFEKKDKYELVFSLNKKISSNDVFVHSIENVKTYLKFIIHVTKLLTRVLFFLNREFSNYKKCILEYSKEKSFEEVEQDILNNKIEKYLFVYDLFNTRIFGIYFTIWLHQIFKYKDEIKKEEELYNDFNSLFKNLAKQIINLKNKGEELFYLGLDDHNELSKLLFNVLGTVNTLGDTYDFYNDIYDKLYNKSDKKEINLYIDKYNYSVNYKGNEKDFYEILLTNNYTINEKTLENIKTSQYLRYFSDKENIYNSNPQEAHNELSLGDEIGILFSNKVLEAFLYENEYKLFLKQYDNRYLFFVHDLIEKDSKKSLYFTLSSGQKKQVAENVFILDYLYNKRKNKNIVVLIDEPDLHLHLDWQRQYIQKLIDVFAEFLKENEGISLHFIIATHSPFILSDVPAENVVLLQKEKDNGGSYYTKVTDWWGREFQDKEKFLEKKTGKGTFGANFVDLIKNGFFFDTKNLMGSFAEEVIDEIAQIEKDEIIKDKEVKDVSDLKKKIKNKIGDSFLRDNLLYFKKSDAENSSKK